jgi:hypothetical protein
MGTSAIVEANNNDKLFMTSVSLHDTCSLISDLRLGDLNYLESVKPTPQRQGRDGLLLITKQPFTLPTNGSLKTTQSGL